MENLVTQDVMHASLCMPQCGGQMDEIGGGTGGQMRGADGQGDRWETGGGPVMRAAGWDRWRYRWGRGTKGTGGWDGGGQVRGTSDGDRGTGETELPKHINHKYNT